MKNKLFIILAISDTRSEIHDFNLTVAQYENQGIPTTLYSTQETIRHD